MRLLNRGAAGTFVVAAAIVLALGEWLGGSRGAGQAATTGADPVVRGMVLEIDPGRRTVLVSHDSIPGMMPAMTMRFSVAEPRELNGVTPGTTVTFTLTFGAKAALARDIRVVPFRSVEQDPLTTRRLKLLQELTSPARQPPIAVGAAVPDFRLIDQERRPLRLSDLRGKVVALNFIYTNCAYPQFCYRTANHFGVLQRRLRARLGRDLVLLTVTFDPVRDSPERLSEYAAQWQADARAWHFLTGDAADVRRVCNMFGVDFFPDEGLLNHSVHTVVIDRSGRLVSNIEGNEFTATQLEDLVTSVLR